MAWFTKTTEQREAELSNSLSEGFISRQLTRSNMTTGATIADPAYQRKVKTSDVAREKVRVQTYSEELTNLAEEAESVLGYSVLKSKMVKPLAKVLEELDIEILNADSVKTYQQVKINEAQNALGEFRGMQRYYWASTPLDQKSWDRLGYHAPFVESIMLGSSSPSSPYSFPIPEFALRKAIQIRKEMPEVNFIVEQLTHNPDPFLVAVLNQERYYIEVWDEPKFEATL